MRRILVAMAMASAMCFQATNASADVIVSLKSGTSQTINQSGTGTLYISAVNTGTASIDFGALALGIQIVADGSPAGDITLAGVDAPDNSVWFNASTTGPKDATLVNGDINGSSGYFAIAITGDVDAEGNYGVLAPGETADLAALSFTAAADAYGTWNVFVVNEEYEQSGATVSNITAGDFSTVQFANAVAPPFPDTGVSYQVGSVIVVPEPSTLTLAGLGCALVGYAAWKRRRNG